MANPNGNPEYSRPANHRDENANMDSGQNKERQNQKRIMNGFFENSSGFFETSGRLSNLGINSSKCVIQYSS